MKVLLMKDCFIKVTLTQMDEAKYDDKSEGRHFKEGNSVNNFKSEVRVDSYQAHDRPW